MIKRALKFAIWPSVGAMVGNVLWRIVNPELFNETWPPIVLQAIISLVVIYTGAFFVVLLIEWVKSKFKNNE